MLVQMSDCLHLGQGLLISAATQALSAIHRADPFGVRSTEYRAPYWLGLTKRKQPHPCKVRAENILAQKNPTPIMQISVQDHDVVTKTTIRFRLH